MARQTVNTGSALADRSGDNGRVAFTKVNENFVELYANHDITAAETAAAVTPTHFGYPPGDVRRYGAVGDGTTDDTTAVTNAIAASTNGLIYVVGRARITSKITVNKRVTFYGGSPLSTYATRTSANGFIKDGAMTTAAFDLTVDGIAMEGLTLDCESGNTGDGIAILANGISLRSVAVYGAGQDGIRVADSAGLLNCNAFSLSHVRSDQNGRDGIRIDSASSGGSVNANVGKLERVSCQENAGSGVYLLKGQWNVLDDVHCELNDGYGIRLGSGAQLNIVIGSDREQNTLGQVRIDASAVDNGLIGVAETEISDAGTGTFRINGDAVAVGQTGTGRVFGNNNGPALSGNDVYMALAADANQRLRVGLSGNAVATGLVPAQILAFATTLMIASRDNSAASVEIRAGSGIPIKGTFNSSGYVANSAVHEKQGAALASANDLVLGVDGNYFQITGTTTINRIANTGIQGGTVVTLKFNDSVTVSHNQAGAAANRAILLAGAANFSATASDTLTLRYDSTDAAWYEMSRAVI